MTSIPTGGPESERQRQLVAAATALRTWVLSQRKAWENQPRVARSQPAAKTPLPPLAKIEVAPPTLASAPRIELVPAAPAPSAKIELAPLPGKPSIQVAEPGTDPADDWSATTVVDPSAVGDAPAKGLWANPALRWAAVAVLVVGVAGALAYPALKGRRSGEDSAESAAPKMGTAVLASIPPGSDVFIDGTPAGKTPVTEELAPGVHRVEFRRRNSSRKLNVEIVAGQSTVEALDWTGKRNGSLEVLTDPSGASVTVDGVARGVTPLTIDDLADGNHAVVLDSSRGTITRSVTISQDAPSQIAEASRGGWLHVSAPIEVRVSDASQSYALDERNQVLMSSGPRDLIFENSTFGYRERRRVNVKSAAVTSVALVPPACLLTVTATLPAEVLIDGSSVGKTPLRDYAMSIGNRAVVVKAVTGAERRFTLVATTKPTALEVDFSTR